MKKTIVPFAILLLFYSCGIRIYNNAFIREQQAYDSLIANAVYKVQDRESISNEPTELPELFRHSFKIINPGKPFNSPDNDFAPVIMPDGRNILFVSNRDGSIETTNTDNSFDYSGIINSFDFWYVTGKEGQPYEFTGPYHNVKELTGIELNTEFNEGAAAFSGNGTYAYFTGCNRPDGIGTCDIYMSNGDDKDGIAMSIPGISSIFWESQPCYSNAANRMYFVSNRPGPNGPDNKDIWYSDWDSVKKVFAEPINMSVINSGGKEWSPFISPDGLTLYFASDSLKPNYGGMDLYAAKFNPETKKWSKPVNLGNSINTKDNEYFLFISPDNGVFYFTSDRKDVPGCQGGMDIFIGIPEK